MVGVIDIGSNSVRLLLSDNGVSVNKYVKITKLAEGLNASGKLLSFAIERTASAVASFKIFAQENGAEAVFAFATAAVRSASNGNDFVKAVKSLCGLDVEVISGTREALLGVTGVLKGADGGVIDIGGASTEIIVISNGKMDFSFSLDLGVVRLREICGQDIIELRRVCFERIKEYGNIPIANFYGIGGTATTLSAIALELEVYDRQKVNGYVLTKEVVDKIAVKLSNLSVEERKKVKGLQPERADVMLGGAVLLSAIMEYIGINSLTVSEDDNLEGYLLLKGE